MNEDVYAAIEDHLDTVYDLLHVLEADAFAGCQECVVLKADAIFAHLQSVAMLTIEVEEE